MQEDGECVLQVRQDPIVEAKANTTYIAAHSEWAGHPEHGRNDVRHGGRGACAEGTDEDAPQHLGEYGK